MKLAKLAIETTGLTQDAAENLAAFFGCNIGTLSAGNHLFEFVKVYVANLEELSRSFLYHLKTPPFGGIMVSMISDPIN